MEDPGVVSPSRHSARSGLRSARSGVHWRPTCTSTRSHRHGVRSPRPRVRPPAARPYRLPAPRPCPPRELSASARHDAPAQPASPPPRDPSISHRSPVVYSPVANLAVGRGMVVGMTTLHDFKLKTIDGQVKSLADYRGKGVARGQRGITLWAHAPVLGPRIGVPGVQGRRLRGAGLSVQRLRGAGAGQRGRHQDLSAAPSYDVTFPLFAKIKVLGDHKEPPTIFSPSSSRAARGPGTSRGTSPSSWWVRTAV